MQKVVRLRNVNGYSPTEPVNLEHTRLRMQSSEMWVLTE